MKGVELIRVAKRVGFFFFLFLPTSPRTGGLGRRSYQSGHDELEERILPPSFFFLVPFAGRGRLKKHTTSSPRTDRGRGGSFFFLLPSPVRSLSDQGRGKRLQPPGRQIFFFFFLFSFCGDRLEGFVRRAAYDSTRFQRAHVLAHLVVGVFFFFPPPLSLFFPSLVPVQQGHRRLRVGRMGT